MHRKTYVFAGGGTGGHLAPGIALAEEFRRRDSTCRIIFVGAGRPIEERMLKDTDFEFRTMSSQPFRQLFAHPIDFIRHTTRALTNAFRLLNDFTPHAVIGLGGYASVPMVVASGLRKIPVWLLEQNALPGRANRWLSNWFPICLTFGISRHWLPIKAQFYVTGNPLRTSILFKRDAKQLEHEAVHPISERRLLLILGGSQGSTAVNRAVTSAIAELKPEFRNWQIIHQTGTADAEAVRAAYSQLGIAAVVEPFFDDLSANYRQASLVISRSGATTLTELTAFGLPAILIPYPLSAEQHQVENALIFERSGGADIVTERDEVSTRNALIQALRRRLLNPQQLEVMSAAMQSQALPRAAQVIVDLITNSDEECHD